MNQGKRKIREGRPSAPTKRKPKFTDTDQGDEDNAPVVSTTTGTERSLENSDSEDEPQVEGYVKVELDPKVEPEIGHNYQHQELFDEHSFGTRVLADPYIDIGDVEVKVLQDEENVDNFNAVEAEVNHRSKAGDRHPIASSSKSSKGKVVNTLEHGSDTEADLTKGENNSDPNSEAHSDVNIIPIHEHVLNKQIEMTGTNTAEGTPSIIKNTKLAVPSQILTNAHGRLEQALSCPDPVASKRDTSNAQGNYATNELSSPCGETLTSNMGMKMEAMQKEIEMLRQEVTYLREEKKELAWFKNKYVKDSNWDSELHFAAYEGTEEVVKKLVKNGAYVNSRNNELVTPIIYAAGRNDITVGLMIIKYLIENGADIYAKDSGNCTFLHNLVSDGTTLTPAQFHDIVTYLISKNLANLFNTTGWSTGQLPLQRAVYEIEVKEETLSALHASGVDFKVIDQDGDNLLCYTLEGSKSSRLMIDLIFLGVDWGHLNKSKQSLLHKAAEYCHVSGTKYLLTLGLDVNAVDNFGNTPLHLVMLRGKGDVLGTTKVLITNGANIEIKNTEGCTPLDEALRRRELSKKDEVIRLLKGSERNNNIREAAD